MTFLFAVDGRVFNDMSVGAGRSMRTLMTWLIEGGHKVGSTTTENLLAAGPQIFPTIGVDILVVFSQLPIVMDVMKNAKMSGVKTVYTLRSVGCKKPEYFAHVDHVLTCSPFLQAHYRQELGIESTAIEPPFNWSEIVATQKDERNQHVTFVTNTPAKGSELVKETFALLYQTRPDIGQFIVAPGTYAQPSSIYAQTRILLVPSVVEESFGRVAAEAMMNGIPPIVSTAGNLPCTVGYGGFVAPDRNPAVWAGMITALWDREELYREASDRAKLFATTHYSESVMRQRYADYFERIAR